MFEDQRFKKPLCRPELQKKTHSPAFRPSVGGPLSIWTTLNHGGDTCSPEETFQEAALLAKHLKKQKHQKNMTKSWHCDITHIPIEPWHGAIWFPKCDPPRAGENIMNRPTEACLIEEWLCHHECQQVFCQQNAFLKKHESLLQAATEKTRPYKSNGFVEWMLTPLIQIWIPWNSFHRCFSATILWQQWQYQRKKRHERKTKCS